MMSTLLFGFLCLIVLLVIAVPVVMLVIWLIKPGMHGPREPIGPPGETVPPREETAREKAPVDNPPVEDRPVDTMPTVVGNPLGPAPVERSCPNCGSALQPEWTHCPSCGAPVG